MRLFASLRPPPPVLDHLETALATLRGSAGLDHAAGLRWTDAADRHLTLAFYGEVPSGYVDDVVLGLGEAAAATAPFEIALRGAGMFDRRTLWIGAAGDTEALTRLMARSVDVGAEVLGRGDDRVRSRAHLTVARRRDGRHRHADLVRALAVYDGPSWRVDELVLVESELGRGRSGSPLHTDVVALPLAQDASAG